jgi:RNA polymerase sigma factor (sigma-70 family)
MVINRHDSSLRDFSTLFSMGAVGRYTDGELLERFAARRGDGAELAFSAIVERHGPMVLRVCRQTLGDAHSAEDAFQATFLVLARRARSLVGIGSLGPWLHEVAWRTASRIRVAAVRRRRHERKASEMVGERASGGEGWDDFGEALHEELTRLPAKFRVPLVLCYLEGLTAEEAARQLGWPPGTVRSRLARGREQMHSRLVRRGLAPSAAVLVAKLASRSAWASVPVKLLSETTRTGVLAASGRMVAGAVPASILTLAKGVLIEMAIAKWKMTGFALLVGSVLASAAMVSAQAVPGPGGNPPESDRFKAVEAKLDRLIQLFERTSRTKVGANEHALLEGRDEVRATRTGDPFLGTGDSNSLDGNSGRLAGQPTNPRDDRYPNPELQASVRPRAADAGLPRFTEARPQNMVHSGTSNDHAARDRLEQRVAELERRIARLEQLLGSTPGGKGPSNDRRFQN